MQEIRKVSSESKPKSVASAIAYGVRKKGSVELQAIGASAINQATKAVAIARRFVVSSGIELISTPGFDDIRIDGKECTGH